MPHKDPEKRKAYQKEYYDNHEELYRKSQREYYARNPDKVKAAIKAWKKANPEKMKAQWKRQDDKRRGEVRGKNKNK